MIRKKGIHAVIIILSVFTLTNIKAMEVVSCGGFDSVPYKPLEFVGNVVSLIKIVVPIILIVMGLIDFTKAVVTSEDKIRRETGKLFIKRIINAIMVYFVIAIVQFIFSLFGTGDSIMTCASCMLGNDCLKENVNINGSTNTGSSSKGKDVKATKILIVQGETAEVVKGSSLKLGVIVQPNNTTNTKVTYKSSKTDIATVNSSGKVTAKKIGTTTVTVTSKSNSKAKDSIKIKVVKKKSSSNNNSSSSNNNSSSNSSNNSTTKGEEIVNYAKKFLGNPYVYGGTSLTNGTDCSGFTMRVYEHFGYKLPRTSSAQSGAGKKVDSLDKAQPGDLLFYSNGNGIGHVAIYIGNNEIIHASNPREGIKISSPPNYKPIAAIRRILK